MHDFLPQLVPRYSANNHLFGKIRGTGRGSLKRNASETDCAEVTSIKLVGSNIRVREVETSETASINWLRAEDWNGELV
jgi:hypothetical protein